jgi:hypothetical protein
MMNPLFEDSAFIVADISLAILVTIAAALTYGRIAFDESRLKYPLSRSIVGMGFTILSLRFWIVIFLGIEIKMPPIAQAGLALVCLGYSLVQLHSIRRCLDMRGVHVICFRDPEFECHREDRIEKAIDEKGKE